jgi:hypothetical protein
MDLYSAWLPTVGIVLRRAPACDDAGVGGAKRRAANRLQERGGKQSPERGGFGTLSSESTIRRRRALALAGLTIAWNVIERWWPSGPGWRRGPSRWLRSGSTR